MKTLRFARVWNESTCFLSEGLFLPFYFIKLVIIRELKYGPNLKDTRNLICILKLKNFRLLEKSVANEL